MASAKALVPTEDITRAILVLRGHRVLLDTELAALYGVTTKRFNEQVRRNAKRFPADFMFQLTTEEISSLRSQIATLKLGRGQHRKYLRVTPYQAASDPAHPQPGTTLNPPRGSEPARPASPAVTLAEPATAAPTEATTASRRYPLTTRRHS